MTRTADGQLGFPARPDAAFAVPPSAVTIGPWSSCSIGQGLADINTCANLQWNNGNYSLMVPFYLYETTLIPGMFAFNGGTVNGNLDMGICDANGVRLVSKGSTAQASTNTYQKLLFATAISLKAGKYYMVMASDNTTGTYFTLAAASGQLSGLGVMRMASAFPIPATLVPAATGTDRLPIYGITLNSNFP